MRTHADEHVCTHTHNRPDDASLAVVKAVLSAAGEVGCAAMVIQTYLCSDVLITWFHIWMLTILYFCIQCEVFFLICLVSNYKIFKSVCA